MSIFKKAFFLFREEVIALVRHSSKYDIELAVVTHKVMRLEAHPFKEITELYWKPTIELLKELARTRPRYLLCFHGSIIEDKHLKEKTGDGGDYADLYLIDRQKRVVYLGTVMDKEESYVVWEWIVRNSPKKSPHLPILLRKGYMAINRHNIRCYIPGNSVSLHKRALEKGVRKFMRTFIPALKSLPIKWLPFQEQEALEFAIGERAGKEAKPQTKEEKMRIWVKDYQDYRF